MMSSDHGMRDYDQLKGLSVAMAHAARARLPVYVV